MKLSDIPNIENYLNRKVKVEIEQGAFFVGVLRGYDGYINVVLDDVTEPNNINSYVVVKGKDIKSIGMLCE